MNILVFNPFGIGDVIFTTPVLRNLKEQIPNVRIVYLCNRRVAPLLKDLALIDEVLVFEKDEWRALVKTSKIKFLKFVFSFFSMLRNKEFDVVFDLSMNSQYGFFLKLIGIKKRIGYNFKNRGRFLTDKLTLTNGFFEFHVADYCLRLLEFLNLSVTRYSFSITVSSSVKDKVNEIFSSFGIKETDLTVGVCPAAGDSWQTLAYYKRWPSENFAQLSQRLIDNHNIKIVLFGSPTEENVCEDVIKHSSRAIINLCGKLSLEEFAAALSLCRGIVTNDGGAFQIAQALSKNIVALFGPTDQRVYGKFAPVKNCFVLTSDVNCRPCYQKFRFSGCPRDKECLRKITVNDVYSLVKTFLV